MKNHYFNYLFVYFLATFANSYQIIVSIHFIIFFVNNHKIPGHISATNTINRIDDVHFPTSSISAQISFSIEVRPTEFLFRKVSESLASILKVIRRQEDLNHN